MACGGGILLMLLTVVLNVQVDAFVAGVKSEHEQEHNHDRPLPVDNPFCFCEYQGRCGESLRTFTDLVIRQRTSQLVCGSQYELCCNPNELWEPLKDQFGHLLPCVPDDKCKFPYGSRPTDVRDFGSVPPCPGLGAVRCTDGKIPAVVEDVPPIIVPVPQFQPQPPLPGPTHIVVPIVENPRPTPPEPSLPVVVPQAPIVERPFNPPVPVPVFERPTNTIVVPPVNPVVVPPVVVPPVVIPHVTYHPIPPPPPPPPVVVPTAIVVPVKTPEPAPVVPVVQEKTPEPTPVVPVQPEPVVVKVPPTSYGPPPPAEYYGPPVPEPVVVKVPPSTYAPPAPTEFYAPPAPVPEPVVAPAPVAPPPVPAPVYGAPGFAPGVPLGLDYGRTFGGLGRYFSRLYGYPGYAYGYPGHGAYGLPFGGGFGTGFGFRKRIGFSSGIGIFR